MDVLTARRRPAQVELGSAELISVVHVESAAAFFGQLMSVDAEAMYNMEEAMQNKYGVSMAPLKPAAAGAFCAAKSSINDTFYRAKVGVLEGGTRCGESGELGRGRRVVSDTGRLPDRGKMALPAAAPGGTPAAAVGSHWCWQKWVVSSGWRLDLDGLMVL